MAVMASPDFASYFGSEKLSDCFVNLSEEPDPSEPGLESWDAANSTDASGQNEKFVLKKQIDVPVPAGQLDVGLQLLKGMYQATPDLSDLSQEQLLDLLLLADRYEVPKVLEAVVARFKAIEQLQWSTVLKVYQMPAGCADMPACKDLYAAAATKLQQELADLELIWGGGGGTTSGGSSSSSKQPQAQQPGGGSSSGMSDEPTSKQQQLLTLPFAALKALLADDRTRVAAEETVYYTIERWFYQCPTPRTGPTRVKQLQQLLPLIRMQHCSQLGVLSMSQSALAHAVLGSGELMLACCLANPANAGYVMQSGCSTLKKYPAWTAAKRPASLVKEVVIDFNVPLPTLQAVVEQHLQDTSKPADLFSEKRVWCGVGLCLQLQVSSAGDSNGSVLGVFCRQNPDFPETVVRSIACKLTAFAAPTQQEAAATAGRTRGAAAALTATGAAAGTQDIIRTWTHGFCGSVGRGTHVLGVHEAFSSWADMEKKLRGKKLVHADKCLHLQLIVTDIQ